MLTSYNHATHRVQWSNIELMCQEYTWKENQNHSKLGLTWSWKNCPTDAMTILLKGIMNFKEKTSLQIYCQDHICRKRKTKKHIHMCSKAHKQCKKCANIILFEAQSNEELVISFYKQQSYFDLSISNSTDTNRGPETTHSWMLTR